MPGIDQAFCIKRMQYYTEALNLIEPTQALYFCRRRCPAAHVAICRSLYQLVTLRDVGLIGQYDHISAFSEELNRIIPLYILRPEPFIRVGTMRDKHSGVALPGFIRSRINDQASRTVSIGVCQDAGFHAKRRNRIMSRRQGLKRFYPSCADRDPHEGWRPRHTLARADAYG